MKRTLIISFFLLTVAASGLWHLSKARRLQVLGELVARMARSDSVVALTFDDGPTPRYTDAALAPLREIAAGPALDHQRPPGTRLHLRHGIGIAPQ